MWLAALKEPVEVQVVGGDSQPLHILLIVIGPLLIAAAAVIAATVAAKTANKRQQEQLTHDLEVRKQDHARDAIAAAVEEVHEALKTVSGFEIEVNALEKKRPPLLEVIKSPDSTQEEIEEAQATLMKMERGAREENLAAVQKMLEMVAITIRLSLRLGKGSPIAEAHEALQDAWEEQVDALALGIAGPRSEQETANANELHAKATEFYSRFHSSCEAWLAPASNP